MITGNEIGVYSEMGKLREVIVGIVPEDVITPPLSYSMLEYLTPQTMEMIRQNVGKRAKDTIPEALEQTRQQVNGLAKVYEKYGVKVHRARPWTEDEDKFLDYIAAGGWPLYARDPMVVVGKTVIEVGIMAPYRRKEIFAFREILWERTAKDPESLYVSMPQPVPHRITGNQPEGPGPFLEGGDVFMMGKEILVGNSGLSSNRAGIEWLQRYLAPDGYTVHEVPLTGQWLHLDCVFAVIRPGLVMANMSAFPAGLPELVKDWDVIEATSEEAHVLGCNSMCLEENVVLTGEEHERLIGELEKHGAEVVTTPMDVAARWGGGIRCSSHPLRRDP